MGVNGIYGLSGSGLDIESMVKVGMMSKQNEYDKMKQKYTLNEWKKAEYVDLYGQLQTFNSSTLTQYKLSSGTNARGASSSNESTVTATANATAPVMTHYVEVGQLASAAYLIGTESIERVGLNDDGEVKTNSVKLADAFFTKITTDTDNNVVYTDSEGNSTTITDTSTVAFSFNVSDGKSGNSVFSTNENLFTAKISDSNTALANGAQTVEITFDANGDRTITIGGEDVTSNVTANNTVTYGGVTYTITATDSGTASTTFLSAPETIKVTYQQLADGYTFNDLVSNINNAGTNVRASYDSVQDIFFLYNRNSGEDNKVALTMNTDDSGGSRAAEFFTQMGLVQSINGEIKTKDTNTTTQTYRPMTTEDYDSFTESDYPISVYIPKYETNEDGSGRIAIEGEYDLIRIPYSEADTLIPDGYYYRYEDGSGYNTSTVYLLDETEETNSGYDVYTFNAGEMSIISGTNAIAKIDGVLYDDLDANNANINGVIYSFNDVTTETDDDGNIVWGSNRVSVTVTQDVDAIVDKVKSFVEDYNNLLTKLYEWYDQEPSSDYKPLTDAQKSAMKDEQIEKWEKKAKEGLLYHDSTLRKIIDDLRDAVGDKVEGNGGYNTAYSIGISTTGLKGQLTLDEEKLRSVLADDPDAVYNVMSKLDDDDDYNYNGVAQRIGDVLTQGLKDIKSVAGTSSDISEESDLNDLLRELQTKMSNFRTMMAAFEEKLFKKYDAMESSLALLGAQLNYVTGAFSQ